MFGDGVPAYAGMTSAPGLVIVFWCLFVICFLLFAISPVTRHLLLVTMKLGLLICDHARKELNHPDGSYPEMFRRILPGFDFTDYYVCDGMFPSSADECHGWLISGSRLSVYEDVDWIHRLKEFTGEIAASGKPCIGVCFGHQMIGAALGGIVGKAETGWCVGVHKFEMTGRENWIKPWLPKANLLMMCQDQVVVLPPDTTVIARSPMCPNAVIRVGKNMLGIQGHPEFSVDFEEKLILANAHYLNGDQVYEGLASLQQIVHSEEVASWMANFFSRK
jgi:GMP synthase-like glutamine amidotransferase